MRQNILTPMAVAVFVVGAGAFTDARAESPWYLLGDMRVGGIHFSVGFDSGHGGRYGEYARPYYRTNHRLRYRGRQCSSFCFRRNRDYYHHESCFLLAAHFTRHDFGPRSWRSTRRGRDRNVYREWDDDRERRYDRRQKRRRGRRGRW